MQILVHFTKVCFHANYQPYLMQEVYISSSIFLTSRKPLGWPRKSLSYCHYGSRRTWKRTSDYFESTDSLSIFSTVFFLRALNVFIYISGVCVVCLLPWLLCMHPHCICSLINAIKSVINHVVLCVQHHYVPSYIKYIVMHRCYGQICIHHWFQALAWKEKKLTSLGMR